MNGHGWFSQIQGAPLIAALIVFFAILAHFGLALGFRGSVQF